MGWFDCWFSLLLWGFSPDSPICLFLSLSDTVSKGCASKAYLLCDVSSEQNPHNGVTVGWHQLQLVLWIVTCRSRVLFSYLFIQIVILTSHINKPKKYYSVIVIFWYVLSISPCKLALTSEYANEITKVWATFFCGSTFRACESKFKVKPFNLKKNVV